MSGLIFLIQEVEERLSWGAPIKKPRLDKGYFLDRGDAEDELLTLEHMPLHYYEVVNVVSAL